MSTSLWLLIGATALMSAVMKGVGPLALGGRELPERMTRVVALLAPALLAALVATQVFARGGHLGVGAEALGVACAGVVFWRGGSVLVGVLIAVLVTAGFRALLPL